MTHARWMDKSVRNQQKKRKGEGWEEGVDTKKKGNKEGREGQSEIRDGKKRKKLMKEI